MNVYTLPLASRAATLLVALTLTLTLGLALGACGGDGDSGDGGGDTSNNASNNASAEECQPGFLDCACIGGVACYPGTDWSCIDGTCQMPECEVGQLGCACYANDTCDTDELGRAMTCSDGGICEAMACPAGSQGCPCADGSTCFDNLACQLVDGVALCEEPGCPRGDEGCSCFSDRSCGEGLVCQDNTCHDTTCDPGEDGCACNADLSCDGGLRCTEDEVCEAITCTPGAIGCICDDADACLSASAFCDLDGMCQRVDCPAGEEGCACADGVCGDGLTCSQDNVCRSDSCAPGSAACACLNGHACEGGLECVDGTCLAEGCTAGTENCACAGGGCGQGLTCKNGEVCIDNTGYVNGACLDNGACFRGGRCSDGRCEACLLGREGCACREVEAADTADPCNTGLTCLSDVCVDQNDILPEPNEEVAGDCRSSCSSDFNDGTTFIPCVDGLIEGCFNDQTCVEGSCVATELDDPATCLDDNDCPDWQRCHSDGVCHSECDEDNPCSAGLECYQYTCRVPCTAESQCDSGYTCDSDTGDNGFCTPLTDTGGSGSAGSEDEGDGGVTTSSGSAPGSFTLSTYTLSFSNTKVSGTFQVKNNADTFKTFTVRKKSHRLTEPDGSLDEAVFANDGAVFCEPLYTSTVSDDELDDPARKSCTCERSEALDCTEGASGCTCGDGDTCDAGLACVSGYCRPNGCAAGTEDCNCDQGLCDDGLTCEDGSICRDVDDGFTCSTDDSDVYCDTDASDGDLNACVAGTLNYSCDEGRCRPSGCVSGICPLFWLQMGQEDDVNQVEELTFGLDAGRALTLHLDGADGYGGDAPGVSWLGEVEVESEDGKQSLTVDYREVPEGQWTGDMVYLATFGTSNLDNWVNDKANYDVERVGNALVQRWVAFRSGNISWEEFQAVLTATRNESWRWSNVQEACPAGGGACYLYDISQRGVETYSGDLDEVPIPTGAVELPFTANLAVDASDPSALSGKIVSNKSLQYAGDPFISLTFDVSPDECSANIGIGGGSCAVFVEDLDATVLIGGRYATDSTDTGCTDQRSAGDGYEHYAVPWLVPGFTEGTTRDDDTGLRYRYECRDGRLPFDDDVAESASLALSNPIPDGRARKRTIKVVDGALINQSSLFIIFEETFDPFLDTGGAGGGAGGCASDAECAGDQSCVEGLCLGKGFSAYGYMLLKRNPTDLEEEDFVGSLVDDTRDEPVGVLDVSCTQDLLDQVLTGADFGKDLTDDGVPDTLTNAIITGVSAGTPQLIDGASDEEVHYFCHDTGQFDGGPGVNDANPTAEACPAESKVVYFTVDKNVLSSADVVDASCQDNLDVGGKAGCLARLNTWRDNGYVVQESDCMDSDPDDYTDDCEGRNLVWRCSDGDKVYCDADRYDLLDGKEFFEAGQEAVVFVRLESVVQDAFRYKTRFVSSRGSNPGFAPEICVEQSDAVPYCYSPTQIEEIVERVDCLLHIQDEYYDELTVDNQAQLNAYLEKNFAYDQEYRDDRPLPIIHDGFERLYAELLIMLGDEAYTRAFSSRFDLAGTNTASFEGSLFEEDGVNLSGIAGFELYSLYQAVQHYSMVLDRFYSHSPLMAQSIELGTSERNFITPETVTRYFDRLIRASAQRSKAYAEISKRYADINQIDLARRVAERAYTATYLESVVISRMMLKIIEEAAPEDRAQIASVIEDAQLRYRSALLDMANVHSSIKDNLTIFGFEPDYVPFPAIDTEDFRQSNAFELLLRRAESRVEWAKEREQRALDSNRSFNTDAAQFQSELTEIRNTYENQLAEICGTFVDGDTGRVYPAIEKYAYLNERASIYGDPCGMMGNGEIYNAMAEFEGYQIDVRSVVQQMQNTIAEADIEKTRVARQCNEIEERLKFEYGDSCALNSRCTTSDTDPSCVCSDPNDGTTCFLRVDGDVDGNFSGCDDGGIAGEILDYEQSIKDKQFAINRLQSTQQFLATTSQLSACSVGLSSDCPTSLVALGTYLVGTAVTEGFISDFEKKIQDKEKEIAKADNRRGAWVLEQECDMALIDSNARTETILLRLDELELEALRQQYRVRVAQSEIERLRQKATRLQMQQKEAEQLSINVQAAHNDPNIRIYRNDSIINAEVAFDLAIRDVYRLTRVFEYYTSQTYAQKDDLFLVRMVSYGDPNLENYLAELRSTFYEFEELFGHPSSRVMMLSLRDDILNIPTTDDDGFSLNREERTGLMRDELTDAAYLDENGYISIPFSTNIDQLSPLTRNHKILYLKVNIDGSGFGDHVARVYLRQRGTGTLKTLSDEKAFYRFDERISVVNPTFNGSNYFDPSIYANYTLRDRPVANTHWELVINQRDEEANLDIDLNGITDVKVYVYYGDFTRF